MTTNTKHSLEVIILSDQQKIGMRILADELKKNNGVFKSNPAWILGMLNEIDSLRAENERLQSKLTRLTDFLENMFPGAEWLEEVTK